MSKRRTSFRLRVAAAIAAIAAALGATLAATPADAAASSRTIRSAISPTLTPAGHAGLLLTTQRPHKGPNNTLYAASSRSGTGFGRSVDVGQIGDQTYPAIALNGSGRGVIAWGTANHGGATMVRLRSANGAWGRAWQIPGSGEAGSSGNGAFEAAVNGHGAVAVLTTSRKFENILVTHNPGGAWRVRRLPAPVAMATSVGIGPNGGVWVAQADPPRGGDGPASAGYMSPSGHWNASIVGQERHYVQDASIQVSSTGRPYLIVGRPGDWVSTWDTEGYWATRYVVLTKTNPTGSWHQVWNTDGATQLTSTIHGGRLRLAWIQDAKPDAHRYPQLLKLQTQVVAPSSGTVSTLVTRPTSAATYSDDGIDFALAQDNAGCNGLTWRAHTRSRTFPLHAWHNGTTTSFGDSRTPVRRDTQGQIACTGTGSAYLARTVNQVLGNPSAGGDVRISGLR